MDDSELNKKLTSLERRLKRLDKKFDVEKRRSGIVMMITVTLALVAIAVTYFTTDDAYSGMAITVFAAVVIAVYAIQEHKELKAIVGLAFLMTLSGIIVYAFGKAQVGTAIWSFGILSTCVLAFFPPRWLGGWLQRVIIPALHAFRDWAIGTDENTRIEKKDFIALVPTYFIVAGYLFQQGHLALGAFLVAMSLLALWSSVLPMCRWVLIIEYAASVAGFGYLSVVVFYLGWVNTLTRVLNEQPDAWVIHLLTVTGIIVSIGLFIIHLRNIVVFYRTERKHLTSYHD